MLRVNGFFGHIQRNNLRSALMFLGFAVACQLIGIAMLVGLMMFFDQQHHPLHDLSSYFQKYGVVIFLISAVLLLMRFGLHVSIVRKTANFKIVAPGLEPRLCKIVEVLAIGAGISMPKIAVVENEALNAFACGLGQKSAVVVVTRGLLQSLDDDELEAVIAHEITHIVNGDIQLLALANVILTMLLIFKKYNPFQVSYLKMIIPVILVLIALAIVLSGGMATFFVMMSGPVWISMLSIFVILSLVSGFVTSLGMTLAKLSRLLIASSREFIADAEAVRMTKNPAALISALKRIEGRSKIDGIDETLDAMMIDGAVEGAFASHPTITDRIAVLSRHAGAMVHGSGSRKDTRTCSESGTVTRYFEEYTAKSNDRFPPQPVATNVAVKKPKWLLIDRVNAGSGENAFGLSPMARNFVLLGILGIVVLSVLQGYAMKRAVADIGGNLVPTSQWMATSKYLGRPGSKNSMHIATRRSLKLASMDPLESRCFANKQYYVGDRDLRAFLEPIPERVKAIVAGTIEPRSSKDAEIYAATQIKTQIKVQQAVDQISLDKALANYVRRRVDILTDMHRFYDDDGLDWMREAYESLRDQKIVAQLNQRFLQVNNADKNSALYKKVALLVDNSRDFIPCYARAIIGPPKPVRKVGAAQGSNANPKLPVLKISLRGTN